MLSCSTTFDWLFYAFMYVFIYIGMSMDITEIEHVSF